MIKKYITPVALILLVIFNISCGSSRQTIAIEEGWEILGELTVNFARDVDKLEVNSTNKYTAIRFKVDNKAVRIRDLKVVFSNLDKLEPSIDDEIAKGQYSRIIELGADGKELRTIEFKYRSTGNIFDGRAKVMVFGKRYVNPGY